MTVSPCKTPVMISLILV